LYIETQNGIDYLGLAFHDPRRRLEELQEAIERCCDLVMKRAGGFLYPIAAHVVALGAGVILLARLQREPVGPSTRLGLADPITGDLEQAIVLSELACTAEALPEDLGTALRELAQRNDHALSTLAAEVLTIHGQPSIPHVLHAAALDTTRMAAGGSIGSLVSATPHRTLFEDRIDVHSYNWFEYVHPGYARQVVTMARYLSSHAPGPRSVIDVGTGPGAALLILLDLLPDLKVAALEPSPTAVRYLRHNVRHLPAVSVHEIDFLDFNPAGAKFDAIVSTGASHHFNTAFFLQQAAALLTEGQMLVIADEFISPYASRRERLANLIKHHSAYMLPISFPIESVAHLRREEAELVRLFMQEVPVAVLAVTLGEVEWAATLLRQLLHTGHALASDRTISDPLMAFYRLQLLELEAMVAGFDYEVEQKTWVKRLVLLAGKAGFDLVDHERVYATSGGDDFDAGTHVLAFRRGKRRSSLGRQSGR
jgi:SAM-dependent methyltransferase